MGLEFNLQRLISRHDSMHRDIDLLETKRLVDRSSGLLVKIKALKRQKLQLKDAITSLEKKMGELNDLPK